jgi:hypothetical protein
MKLELHLWNCLWLILPLLVWNIILGPKIKDERITSDGHSPKWLLMSENILRVFVFMLPLFIPLQLTSHTDKIGFWVYGIGTLIYFASWLPFLFSPQSAWCDSLAGLLAPRLTPFISFLGVAVIGESWSYGVIAALFIALHIWHGLQNMNLLTKLT